MSNTAPISHPEHDQLANSLEAMVDKSTAAQDTSVHTSAVAPAHEAVKRPWFSSFFDPHVLPKLFAYEHLGNFVIANRATQEQTFESMPLYARVGMHLLFYGKEQTKLLRWDSVEELLKKQSIKQGRLYDETDPAVVLPHIQSFVETYSIATDDLLIKDLTQYKTMNEFFSRKLAPGARVIADPEDSSVVTSAADCRLTVWKDFDTAKKVWVKGHDFSIASLLNHDESLIKLFGAKPSLAIFRLAPQDYHRFHSPAAGDIGETVKVPGTYYTVNPQAVNEDFDVFTANRRDITILHSNIRPAGLAELPIPIPIGIVAIGALLVGSINWSKPINSGASIPIAKGEDLGWFQYGGSTVIALFPQDACVVWDADLVNASNKGLETVVKIGERIGKVGGSV